MSTASNDRHEWLTARAHEHDEPTDADWDEPLTWPMSAEEAARVAEYTAAREAHVAGMRRAS